MQIVQKTGEIPQVQGDLVADNLVDMQRQAPTVPSHRVCTLCRNKVEIPQLHRFLVDVPAIMQQC